MNGVLVFKHEVRLWKRSICSIDWKWGKNNYLPLDNNLKEKAITFVIDFVFSPRGRFGSSHQAATTFHLRSGSNWGVLKSQFKREVFNANSRIKSLAQSQIRWSFPLITEREHRGVDEQTGWHGERAFKCVKIP